MYYIEMAIVHDLVNFFFRKVNLVLTKISVCAFSVFGILWNGRCLWWHLLKLTIYKNGFRPQVVGVGGEHGDQHNYNHLPLPLSPT